MKSEVLRKLFVSTDTEEIEREFIAVNFENMIKRGEHQEFFDELLGLFSGDKFASRQFLGVLISELDIYWGVFVPTLQKNIFLGIQRHASHLGPQDRFTLFSILGEKADLDVAQEILTLKFEDELSEIEILIHALEHLKGRMGSHSEKAHDLDQKLTLLYHLRGKPRWQ